MRTIEIVPYCASWPADYAAFEARLIGLAVRNVVRIDHIGSTAVPGLAAKDVIDIQVTVRDLGDPEHVRALKGAGFRHKASVDADLLTGMAPDSPERRKQYFREPEGERRAHIYIRQAGRLNQRYALLFRDYLRSEGAARQAYEAVKRRLADIYPHDIDGYLAIKDPVMDVIHAGAEHWAASTGWCPSGYAAPRVPTATPTWRRAPLCSARARHCGRKGCPAHPR